MNTTEQILVVILAAALAVLLILAIAGMVYLIKLIKTLQVIVSKAEHLVENAEEVSNMVRQTVGRVSLVRFVQSVVEMVRNKSK